MDGLDVGEDGIGVHHVAAEGQVHVFYGRVEKLLGGREVYGRYLILLNDRLHRYTGAGVPDGEHIDLVLAELLHEPHCFGNLVGMVRDGRFDLPASHSPFHLIDITQVVLEALGMILTPRRGRPREVDDRSHLDALSPDRCCHTKKDEGCDE